VRQCRLRRFRPLEQVDEAGFDRSVAVNLKGPFFLVQALLPIFANPASIVLNTSINARIGMPNTTVYAATNAGLASLVRTLSGELIGRGIRVNAVSPGPTATPMHEKPGLVGAHLDALVGQIPAGRRGHPDEIAQAIVFLAPDEAAFTVGSELVIDGGMSNL
jgi:NAD(P)-dependent dehydrogenase (short-subunit alcohol dehydrogenase family)